MVADSITDSELFHGSPISIDFAKKSKANWFCKLKQWKIDARRKQWIYQWKRANLGEEENGRRLKSLLEKLTDQKAWRIDYDDDDDDDEIDLERTSSSASSPTSVLKSKDSVSGDCFCCSKQMTEEDQEEVFDDAYDNWDGFRDALNSFDNESPRLESEDFEQEEDPIPDTSQRREKSTHEKLFHEDKKEASPANTTIHRNSKKKKRSNSEKQRGDDGEECPICSELMDATDLEFQPCPCGFRICLFCHKKISENEARCPVCRKDYVPTSNTSGEVGFQQRGGGKIRLSPSFRGLDRA
ncbi:Zinc finger RING-type [Arabidopsis suecica]|uniref:Zinc finger RING-type n=1 Tax=Arabidopsis suecica TaxID=45249 RepID=A0A8T2BTE6_ARASU|nr:Zinc finger RING-type [Arabidopsis suecica]